jgi:hypothetical protein
MNIWKALLWTTILILTMNFLGFIISSISYYLQNTIHHFIFFQSILIVIIYYFFLRKILNYKIDFKK